jgi:thioredoxin 1
MHLEKLFIKVEKNKINGAKHSLASNVYSSQNFMSAFTELIDSEKPVLVDFTATWCGPCKMMAPILEDVKKRVGDAVRIVKIDIDKNPVVASSYQIQSVPTLLVFKKGEIKWRQSGVIAANELEKILNQYK